MAHHLAIVGASGYGGAELLRLADAHPTIEVAVVAAHSQADSPVAELFPNIAGERRFDAVDVEQLTACDVVVLGTPHGPALQLGAELVDAGTKVVDLSAAFRLSVDGFTTWYGETHPRPDLAAGDDRAAEHVAYGLPELTDQDGMRLRERIRGATLVANPGCYPTAALLGLAPLADLVEPGTVVIDGKSGTSGAGRAASDRLHFAHVHADVTAYAAPTHRHTGEIERWLPTPVGAVSFTPHLVPMARGLLTTSSAVLADGVDADQVADALHDAYGNEPFVHLLAPGTFPHTKALAGANGCQLSAVVDPRTRRVLVTAAIDNLGKGAAGQALQNVNLLLGEDETLGLTAIGTYP